jgi:hypothetical protein
MFLRNRIVLAIAVCFTLLPASTGFTQTQTTGRISGTVKDQNGALISGAEVILISGATSEKREVTTDGAGNYSVPLLSPGRYQVIISASGFATVTLPALIVLTETTPLDITSPLSLSH